MTSNHFHHHYHWQLTSKHQVGEETNEGSGCIRNNFCSIPSPCGGGGGGARGGSLYQYYAGRHRSSGGNTLPTESLDQVAKEMNELSFQERERILEEVHGVAKVVEETPEFVKSSLEQFDQALLDFPKRSRRALDKAVFLRPSLLSNTNNNSNNKKTTDHHDNCNFKLLFLRADHFNAKKAVERMVKFFDFKRSLFGDDKLAKDITLDDLEEKEIEGAFYSGSGAVLPGHDQSGRPIVFHSTSKFDLSFGTKSALRCAFYIYMTLLREDEAASKKGICSIFYTPGRDFVSNPGSFSQAADIVTKSGDMFCSIPVRFTGYHFCYNNAAMKIFLSTVQAALGKEIRLRLRAHYGSPLEIQYSLLTFGVNCQGLFEEDQYSSSSNDVAEGGAATSIVSKDPSCATENSNEQITHHQRQRILKICKLYMERRRTMEEKLQQQQSQQIEAATGVIQYPNPQDVLIGRGVPYQEFSGNRRFLEIIESQSDRHQNAKDKFTKTCISMGVVKTIQEDLNGRFLSRIEEQGWREIDTTEANAKTSIAFRSMKQAIKSRGLEKQQQQQQYQQNPPSEEVNGSSNNTRGSDQGISKSHKRQRRR